MSVVECDIPFCSLSFFVISWEVVNVCHIILNRLNKDDLLTRVCFCVCVCSPQRASTSSASDIYCTRWRTAARQTASPSINTLLSPTRLWVCIVKHTHTLYIDFMWLLCTSQCFDILTWSIEFTEMSIFSHCRSPSSGSLRNPRNGFEN